MRQDAVNFLKNLKASDNAKIFSHVDADGICSLVILIRFLRRRGIIEKDKIPIYQLTDVPPNFIETSKVMIFLDLNSDTVYNYVNEKSLLIDHHIFGKKPKGVFYNPRETEPASYIPAAYLVYDICSELEEMEDARWIAAVGVLGDKGELNSKICRDFIDVFDNVPELQKVSDFIYSAFLVEGNIGNDRMVKALANASSPKDIIEDSYFRYCFDEVQREVAKSRKKIEKDGIFRFVNLKSKYNIKSIVAAQMLEKEKGVIVVACTEADSFCKMSIRTDTNINLGSITKKAADLAGGTGGGHEKAAGARVPKSRFGIFREALISGVEKI